MINGVLPPTHPPLHVRAAGRRSHSLRAGKHLPRGGCRTNPGLLPPATAALLLPGPALTHPAGNRHLPEPGGGGGWGGWLRRALVANTHGKASRLPPRCGCPQRCPAAGGGRKGEPQGGGGGKRPAQRRQRRGATPRVAARFAVVSRRRDEARRALRPGRGGGHPAGTGAAPPSRAGWKGWNREPPPPSPARTHRMPEQEVHTKLPTVMSV